MHVLLAVGGIWLFFKIVVPLIILAVIVWLVARAVRSHPPTFSASEPRDRGIDSDRDLP
ncbi:MAG TPA: hypothetical protein V6D47_04705 [Oscillatoriaceae cyanobacterium]